nr:transposase [Nonomuraea diastatica]
MTRRVSPTQAIRTEIDALFASDRDLVEVIEDVARLGARLIIQTAVEAEVDGRARYQRAATVAAEESNEEDRAVRPGYRNGHCPTTVKTTSGPITTARPKLLGTTEKFASRLFGTGVTRTHALETFVIASFVRGMSVRDVEGALDDALGPEAALSKSTVSTICQAIVAEYDAWCRRDLSTVELDYLSLDASHFKMHDGSRAEPILAAWGITTARQARLRRPGRHRSRVHRRLARLPVRPGRPRPEAAAADHLRRRARSDQRCRAGLPRFATPTVSGSSKL